MYRRLINETMTKTLLSTEEVCPSATSTSTIDANPILSTSKQFISSLKSLVLELTLPLCLVLVLGVGNVWGQTYYDMSSGDKTWNFADMANWTNNFASGTDAANWKSVGIIGTGSSVTTGTRTTKSSATFVSTSTGGLQKGTQTMVFLSTGSSATPEAVAVDLLLNFSGRTAGTLSFDWTALDNGSGTRPTSLRVFWTTDGTTFTEITGAQVLDKVSSSSGSITNVALPTQFNGSSTAVLRFYNHAGTVTGSGNRDKMQIDNVAVTSTAATTAPAAPTISSITPGNQELSVAFTAGSDGGSAITTYKYSTDGGTNWQTRSSGTTASPLVISTLSTDGTTALTNGVSYNIQIRAVNSVGDGTATASTAATPRTTPSAPTITGITPGNQQLSVAFTAGSDGGSAITTYKYSTNGGTNWQTRSAGTTASPLVISTLSTDGTTGLTNGVSYDIQIRAVNAAGDGTASSTTSGTPAAPVSPTLNTATLSSALSSTYGTASTGVSFIANGSNLTGNISATAQTGYEVSTSLGSGYGASVSVAAGTAVYVRFSATQTAGSYNGVTAVVLTSSGATAQNVTTSGSGNEVTPKGLTVTGLTAQDKVYNGLTGSTVTGTAALSGVVGADNVSLSGTPTFNFVSANVGTAITVNTTGYSLSGTASTNYTLSQPSFTANITVRSLTITANNVSKFAGATLTGGSGSTAFSSNGLQNGELIGTVTISYGFGAAAGDPIGVYTGQVTPSNATGGTFNASNYSITYGTGDITVVEAPITIAEWDFTSSSASSSNAGITIPVVSQGNNNGTTTLISTASASSGYTNASGGNNAGVAARTGSLVTGSNGSAYFEFTITPNPGFQVTLREVTFGSRETSTGPKAITLRSSADNYASDIFTATLMANSLWALKSNGSPINELINLSSSRTFRIYGYDGTGSAGASTANWRIDDLKLLGYVKSVPQLSSTTVSNVGTSSATLGATITSDGSAVITERGTFYGTSAAPTVNSLFEGGTTVSAFSHSRTGLTPNTDYYFRGYAVNAIGTGYSPDGTFTTIHNAPTIQAGSNATSTSIDANWLAPVGGSATFTYEIQVDDNNDFSSPTYTQTGVSSSLNTITANGLTPNTTYYCRVRANNAGGSSAWSSTSVGYATLIVVNPTLSATALTAFGDICLNETSSANSFTINGAALTTDDVIISSLTGYTFSTTMAGTYTTSLSLSQPGGSYAQTIYVKFTPTAVQSYNGNIVISGGGTASNVNVAASGGGTVGTLSLSTTPVSSLMYLGGVSGGSSIAVSCGTIAAKGIVYSSSANPTLASTFTTDGTGTANYTSNINLATFSSGQEVYYRAYATTSNGLTSYGNELSLIVPAPPCSDIFISEYVEGSSNNKYIELYNPTSNAVNLSNYSLRYYANGSATVSNETILTGTLQAYSTVVLRNSSATVFTGSSVVASAVNFNGDDAIALSKNGVNIDVFGQIGFDPGTAWISGGISTLDKTLRRKFSIVNGDDNGSNTFNPSLEWEMFSIDNVSDLGKFNSPTASNQSFCAVSNPTVSELTTTSGSNIQWYAAASGGSALASATAVASGTYYVSQTQGACESSRAAVTIAVDNLTFTGTSSNGDFIWNGSASNDYSAVNNWYTYNGSSYVPAVAAPSTSTNVIIPANQACVVNQPTLGSSTTVNARNIRIESGATLNLGSGSLNIKGDFTNNGTLDAGTGTVIFSGTSIQVIGGTSPSEFYKLTVNNNHSGVYPSHVAVKLEQDATVTNTLTLTDGILDVFNNVLTLGTTSMKATISPVLGTADSYVAAHHNTTPAHLGSIKQYVHSANIGTAYSFPIGDDGKWTPYNLTFDAGSSIAVGAFITTHVNDALVSNASNSNFVSRIVRDWEVEPSAGITTPNYTIEIFHNQAATETGGLASSGSVPFKKTSGTGQLNAPTNALGINSSAIVEVGTYSSTLNSFTWTGLTSFSNFGGTDVNQALPIELISFQANCKADNTVAVTWTTASEHNTSHYVVEKSRDGFNWRLFDQTAAAGNSTELLTYEIIDSEKASGTTYYRLTQFDNDGLFEVFNPVSVNCNGEKPNNHITTYPNPSFEGFYVSFFTETMEGNGQLTITDASGRPVYGKSVSIQDGNNVFHIGDMNAAPGMYYIQVSNGTTTTDIVKHSLR